MNEVKYILAKLVKQMNEDKDEAEEKYYILLRESARKKAEASNEIGK